MVRDVWSLVTDNWSLKNADTRSFPCRAYRPRGDRHCRDVLPRQFRRAAYAGDDRQSARRPLAGEGGCASAGRSSGPGGSAPGEAPPGSGRGPAVETAEGAERLMPSRRGTGTAGGAHHVEAFLEMMSAERGAATNTLLSYGRDLADYGAFLARRGNGFESASNAMVRAYLIDLDERGFAARSAARRLSAIRQFHRFLFSEGVRADDPTGTIDGPRRAVRLPRLLIEGEVDRLIETAQEAAADPGHRALARVRAARMHALIEMLYATGLRVSELVALPVSAA